MNGRSFKSTVSAKQIVIITVILLILIIAIYLASFLFQKGLIKEWFGDEQTDILEEKPITIPNMIQDDIVNRDSLYYDTDTEDPFANIMEHDQYVRVVRIQSTYGDNKTTDRVTIIKQNQNYRAESSSHLLIYNGETLYISYGSEKLKTSKNNSTYYEELGITSLDEIRSMIEDTANYEVKSEIADNNREINVTVKYLTGEDIRMEFKISIENGIVISERTYLNGESYRYVITESFDISIDNLVDSETFRIPN